MILPLATTSYLVYLREEVSVLLFEVRCKLFFGFHVLESVSMCASDIPITLHDTGTGLFAKHSMKGLLG